jgi:hypothetical protein
MRAALAIVVASLAGCSLLTFDDLAFDVRSVADASVALSPDAATVSDAGPVDSAAPEDATDAAADAGYAGPLFVSRDTARSPLPQCTLTARPAESTVELVRLVSADGPPCPGPSPRFPEGMTSTWTVEPDCRFTHVRTLETEGYSLRIEDEGAYTAPGRAEGTMVQVSNGCEHRWDVRWVDGPCAEPPPESPWLRCRQP